MNFLPLESKPRFILNDENVIIFDNIYTEYECIHHIEHINTLDYTSIEDGNKTGFFHNLKLVILILHLISSSYKSPNYYDYSQSEAMRVGYSQPSSLKEGYFSTSYHSEFNWTIISQKEMTLGDNYLVYIFLNGSESEIYFPTTNKSYEIHPGRMILIKKGNPYQFKIKNYEHIYSLKYHIL